MKSLTIIGRRWFQRGLITRPTAPNGSKDPLWQWAREHGVTFSYQGIDVARERDL